MHDKKDMSAARFAEWPFIESTTKDVVLHVVCTV
jgi:hypothetical protein